MREFAIIAIAAGSVLLPFAIIIVVAAVAFATDSDEPVWATE